MRTALIGNIQHLIRQGVKPNQSRQHDSNEQNTDEEQ
jgi:hypothetical protein